MVAGCLLVLATSGAAVVFAAPTPASAAAAAEVGPRWADLSADQRSQLAPIEREWPRMDERNKQKWIGVAARLATVGPAEHDRIQARMTEWAKLSPQQRGQARLRYQEARQVAPKSRQDRWAAYQALSPEERQRLAARGSHAPHAASAAGNARWRARLADGGVVTRQAIGPTVVQAQPGATTMILSRGATPPVHLRPGLPRIVASPELIDSATLLPKRLVPRPAHD